MSLAQATGLLTVANTVSLVLGLLFNILIARAFGTSADMDAYTIAVSVPESLQYLLMIGTLSLVFTPMFIDLRITQGDAVAWRVANTLLTLIGTGLLLIVILLLPATSMLVQLLAPGFSKETQDLATGLTRLLLPSVLYYAAAGVLLGLCYAYQDFRTPALNAVLVSGLGIATYYLFVVWLELGILGLVIGRLATLVVLIILLGWSAARLDAQFGPRLVLDRRVTHVLVYIPFYVVGAVSGQLSLMVSRRFASELGVGSIAALSYGQRIADIPLALVGVAFGSALLPTLATKVAEGRYDNARQSFFQGVAFLSFLTIPIMIGLVVLRVPIVRLLLARGAFDTSSTYLTGIVVAGLACGLPSRAVGAMVVRGLPAFKTRRAPAMLSAAGSATSIGLTILLVRWLGLLGIALSVAAGDLVYAVLGVFFYYRRLGSQAMCWLMRHLIQVAISGLLMAGAMLACTNLLPTTTGDQTSLRDVVQVLGIGSAGALVYGMSAMVFNADVVRAALCWLCKREQPLGS